MTRPADTVLAAAARAARKRGLTAQEALRIVAQEYGACFGDYGITGWILPEDERAVRKVATTKPTEEPSKEDPNGPK